MYGFHDFMTVLKKRYDTLQSFRELFGKQHRGKASLFYIRAAEFNLPTTPTCNATYPYDSAVISCFQHFFKTPEAQHKFIAKAAHADYSDIQFVDFSNNSYHYMKWCLVVHQLKYFCDMEFLDLSYNNLEEDWHEVEILLKQEKIRYVRAVQANIEEAPFLFMNPDNLRKLVWAPERAILQGTWDAGFPDKERNKLAKRVALEFYAANYRCPHNYEEDAPSVY